jgi:tetratricopeptide (TPR) repeat protein
MNDMLAGRYQSARADLSEALANEPYNPDALVLMGRLYEAVGRHKEWIRVLEESLRKNPGQAALRLALTEARRAGTRKTETIELTDEQRDQRRSAYKAVGITSAGLAFLWGMLKPGQGTVIRDLMAAPGPLLIGTMICALMTGWTMAAVSFIDPVDEELFFQDTAGRSLSRDTGRNDGPLGLAVPFFAVINYFMAVAVMAVLMLTRGVFSRSLAIVSGASFALAFAMALAYPPEASSILAWCPGWLLFCMFAGWFIGDFFRA